MSYQSTCFSNLLAEISSRVATRLSKLYPELSENLNSQFISSLVIPARNLEFGDFALPLFQIVKLIKPLDKTITPNNLDLQLEDDRFSSFVAGGFLNFKLNSEFLRNTVIERFAVATDKACYLPDSIFPKVLLRSPAGINDRAKKIVIDYSSPNIAKPFHVGHLRTTLIGESLTRILRYLGHEVETLNYLGDWGTQFGFVYLGVRDNNPGLLEKICSGEINQIASEITVDDLVSYYIAATTEAKRQATDDSDQSEQHAKESPLLLEARAFFKDLEASATYAKNFWSFCRKISIDYLKSIYQRLGISFDHYKGEAFFEKYLGETKEYLKPILAESNSALGFIDKTGKEDKFIRLYAEDGRSLYLARDVASARYRHAVMKADLLLYVVGSQQTLNFQQLKLVLAQQSPEISDKVLHIPFGFVPGMKTREGGVISLTELLNEASNRALEHDENKNQELAEQIGVGAIYFYFLKHSNIKDFTFKWEEALNFSKDSGPYLQYTLARVNRMLLKADENPTFSPNHKTQENESLETADSEKEPEKDCEINAEEKSAEKSFEIDPAKRQLLIHLDKFYNTLQQLEQTYEPCTLAQYTIELGQLISKLYNSARVIEEDQSVNRENYRLYSAARSVLATSMYLLGVPLLEKM